MRAGVHTVDRPSQRGYTGDGASLSTIPQSSGGGMQLKNVGKIVYQDVSSRLVKCFLVDFLKFMVFL